MILLTFWSNTCSFNSRGFERWTRNLFCPPHFLLAASGSGRCCSERFCDSTLADCISPQVLLSFQPLGLLQQALSVPRMRSCQQPSGLLHCCSWKCGAVHALGANFSLWGLELTDVCLHGGPPLDTLSAVVPGILGGLVPGHAPSAPPPTKSAEAQVSSTRWCSICM